jgi:hypothetical protein
MHAIDPRRFAAVDSVSGATAVIVAAAVIGGFMGLSVRRLRMMDVP